MKITIFHNQSTVDPAGTIPDSAFPAFLATLQQRYTAAITAAYPHAEVEFRDSADPTNIRVADDADGSITDGVERITAKEYEAYIGDFEEEGVLRCDCVRVQLQRRSHPAREDASVFLVVIHPGDRDFTLQSSVCRALETRGFDILFDGRGANGIYVEKSGYSPSADFVAIKNI